jgi:hypothetical protein
MFSLKTSHRGRIQNRIFCLKGGFDKHATRAGLTLIKKSRCRIPSGFVYPAAPAHLSQEKPYIKEPFTVTDAQPGLQHLIGGGAKTLISGSLPTALSKMQMAPGGRSPVQQIEIVSLKTMFESRVTRLGEITPFGFWFYLFFPKPT